MSRGLKFAPCLLFAATFLPAQSELTAVRFWSLNDATRVVVELTSDFEFRQDRAFNPDRLFFDLLATRPRLGKRGQSTFPVNDGRLKQVRVAETQPGTARVVFDLEPGVEGTASRLTNPSRLIVELRRPVQSTISPVQPVQLPALAGPVKSEPVQSKVAKPANLDIPRRSMTRILGLKIGRIVLDAGHGGNDTGTIGPDGLCEKDLVLDVTRRLGALIEKRLGAEVIYTRMDDTFIPLERRTQIANEAKSDLFLSIHANSSPADSASGVETYYLNFTSSESAMEVAARENASAQKSVFELKDLLQRIAMQDKIDESREFAEKVQRSLYTASLRGNARTRDRGVRKAPFVVLIGASMPSVLAEIGFVSNPRDEALLRRSDYRQRVAEGLYQGVSRYADTLSHLEVAQK